MKYQILFSEKIRKTYHQFVIDWISPERVKVKLNVDSLLILGLCCSLIWYGLLHQHINWSSLTLSILDKNYSRWHFEILFFLFLPLKVKKKKKKRISICHAKLMSSIIENIKSDSLLLSEILVIVVEDAISQLKHMEAVCHGHYYHFICIIVWHLFLKIWTIQQAILTMTTGDNLHEMSEPIFWET